jgi:hypothetical protein
MAPLPPVSGPANENRRKIGNSNNISAIKVISAYMLYRKNRDFFIGETVQSYTIAAI